MECVLKLCCIFLEYNLNLILFFSYFIYFYLYLFVVGLYQFVYIWLYVLIINFPLGAARFEKNNGQLSDFS